MISDDSVKEKREEVKDGDGDGDDFFFLAVPPTGELSVTLFKQTLVGISMLGDGTIDDIMLAWILSLPGSSRPTGTISRE